ncbi:MAG TPA: hypothetical protein VJL86_12455 [Steroidobacteraceae bacterium]|nr:hypothetical protein [Steroidobacteraceae bacterium]
MLRRTLLLASLLAGSAASHADEAAADKAASPVAAETAQVAAAQAKPDATGSKTLSGISILGNQEAPKALVIVPWKSSEIGDPLGLAENLDGSRRPVDREVFMRELDYYDIRSGSE